MASVPPDDRSLAGRSDRISSRSDVTTETPADRPPWAVPDYRAATLVQMLDAVPTAIALWDRELRNVFANRAWIEWLGMTPDQMRGRHASVLLSPEMFELDLPCMQRALAG